MECFWGRKKNQRHRPTNRLFICHLFWPYTAGIYVRAPLLRAAWRSVSNLIKACNEKAMGIELHYIWECVLPRALESPDRVHTPYLEIAPSLYVLALDFTHALKISLLKQINKIITRDELQLCLVSTRRRKWFQALARGVVRKEKRERERKASCWDRNDKHVWKITQALRRGRMQRERDGILFKTNTLLLFCLEWKCLIRPNI